MCIRDSASFPEPDSLASGAVVATSIDEHCEVAEGCTGSSIDEAATQQGNCLSWGRGATGRGPPWPKKMQRRPMVGNGDSAAESQTNAEEWRRKWGAWGAEELSEQISNAGAKVEEYCPSALELTLMQLLDKGTTRYFLPQPILADFNEMRREHTDDLLAKALEQSEGREGVQTVIKNLYWLRGADGMFDMEACLLYTSPSPRDATLSRMPSSA